MKKIEILKTFNDVHTKEKYVVGMQYEVTAERFAEMQENLSKHDGVFIKEIKQRKRKKKDVIEVPTEEEGA